MAKQLSQAVKAALNALLNGTGFEKLLDSNPAEQLQKNVAAFLSLFLDFPTRMDTELKKLFRPEFLNRVDEIVVFKSLTGPQLRGIVDLMVVDLRNRMIAQGMSIEFTDAARDLIAKEGTDPIYGARPLRRAIQTMVEDPLAERMLQGEWKSGDIILVDEKDGELTFEVTTGEIPQVTERTHLELPTSSTSWSAAPAASRPGAGSGAAGGASASE